MKDWPTPKAAIDDPCFYPGFEMPPLLVISKKKDTVLVNAFWEVPGSGSHRFGAMATMVRRKRKPMVWMTLYCFNLN